MILYSIFRFIYLFIAYLFVNRNLFLTNYNNNNKLGFVQYHKDGLFSVETMLKTK